MAESEESSLQAPDSDGLLTVVDGKLYRISRDPAELRTVSFDRVDPPVCDDDEHAA